MGYEYEYTWLDYVEEGWKTIFLEMCEEIQSVLEYEALDFRIIDIKEKYGEMRVYTSGVNDKIISIIEHYREMSKYVCIECGRAATHLTTCWTRPYCEKCIPENIGKDELMRIER